MLSVRNNQLLNKNTKFGSFTPSKRFNTNEQTKLKINQHINMNQDVLHPTHFIKLSDI